LKPGFKSFVNHLFRSELLKNASLLFSGTVLAQAISLLLQPFLRRFFTPEAFGAFSVYLSLVGMITVISSMKYDDAVLLPENDKDAVNIVGGSIILNFIVNIILFLIVLLYGKWIVRVLELPGDKGLSILFLVPAGAFLYSTYQCMNNWLVRKKRFLDLSINKLVRRSTEGAAQVVFALLKSFKGLVYSDIIGQIMNVGSSLVMGLRSGFSFRLINKESMIRVFLEYSDFPKYYLVPSFMSTCSFLLPAVIINKFFKAEYAGYFDLAKVLLSVPLAFIASSLSSVIFQKISEKYQKRESFIHDLKPVFFVIMLICTAELLVIIPFGVRIFTFVFGDEWEISGEISRILVWSFAFNFAVAVFSSVFISLRRIKVYGIWQIIYFLAILSLGFFRHLDFVSFLKVYVAIELCCYALVSILMVAIILNYEKTIKLPAN
jgi:O-antigen/teichoic acid export membrane protein